MNVTLNNNAFIALDYLNEEERKAILAAISRIGGDVEMAAPNLQRLHGASSETYDLYLYRVDPTFRLFLKRGHSTPTQIEVMDVVRAERLRAYAQESGN